MKKTILTTTMALGLGFSSFAAADNAEASEQNINKENLAEMALADSEELNNAPIHKGSYHYNFNLDNVNYNFESDGTNYSWSYNGYTGEQPEQNVEAQPVQQTAPQVEEVEVEETAPVQETQNVETEEAPEVIEEPVQQEEPAQQTETTQAAAPQSTSSNDGSVKEQFHAAGGTQAMWDSIVMPESSGDPNAVNELGYQGLGQTKEYWGTGSVETQTEGMIDYANERYGSVSEAIQFREANNWW